MFSTVYKSIHVSTSVFSCLQFSKIVYYKSIQVSTSVLKMSATVYKRPNVKIGVYKSLQV